MSDSVCFPFSWLSLVLLIPAVFVMFLFAPPVLLVLVLGPGADVVLVGLGSRASWLQRFQWCRACGDEGPNHDIHIDIYLYIDR